MSLFMTMIPTCLILSIQHPHQSTTSSKNQPILFSDTRHPSHNEPMCYITQTLFKCCNFKSNHVTECADKASVWHRIQKASFSRVWFSYSLCDSCQLHSPTFPRDHLWDGYKDTMTSARRKQKREELRNPPPPSPTQVKKEIEEARAREVYARADAWLAKRRAAREAESKSTPEEEIEEVMIENPLYPNREEWVLIAQQQHEAAAWALGRELKDAGYGSWPIIEEPKERVMIELPGNLFSRAPEPIVFEADGRKRVVKLKEMIRSRPRPAGRWVRRITYWDFYLAREVRFW